MTLVRWGLVVFFLLVLFDGALRKWVFPSLSTILFVLKDGVLVVTLGIYLLKRGLHLPATVRTCSLGILLPVFVWWCALEAFNFHLPNAVLGIWGFKLHVLYASLVLLIPSAFRSFNHLYKYIRIFAITSIPILILGIVQFYSPSGSFINTYVDQSAENVARFGENQFARITGTFSYIAGMGRYVFFAPLLTFMLLLGERLRISLQTLPLYAALGLGAIVVPMNGSRWPVFAFAIVLFILLYFSGRIQRVAKDVISPFRMGLLVTVILLSIGTYGTVATSALQERIVGADDSERRIVERIQEPFELVEKAGFYGYGVGSTYQAASVLVSSSVGTWGPSGYYEEAPERLMLELGVIGFLLQYLLYAGILLYAYRIIHRANEPRRLFLAIASFSFVLVHLTEHVAFNAVASAFFWGFVGILVALGEESRTYRILVAQRVPQS